MKIVYNELHQGEFSIYDNSKSSIEVKIKATHKEIVVVAVRINKELLDPVFGVQENDLMGILEDGTYRPSLGIIYIYNKSAGGYFPNMMPEIEDVEPAIFSSLLKCFRGKQIKDGIQICDTSTYSLFLLAGSSTILKGYNGPTSCFGELFFSTIAIAFPAKYKDMIKGIKVTNQVTDQEFLFTSYEPIPLGKLNTSEVFQIEEPPTEEPEAKIKKPKWKFW